MSLSIFWSRENLSSFDIAMIICARDVCVMVNLCGNHFTVLKIFVAFLKGSISCGTGSATLPGQYRSLPWHVDPKIFCLLVKCGLVSIFLERQRGYVGSQMIHACGVALKGLG